MPTKNNKQPSFNPRDFKGKGLGGLDPETAKKLSKEAPKKKRSMFARGKD